MKIRTKIDESGLNSFSGNGLQAQKDTDDISMPNVLYCSVQECAYNEKEKCHAGAITVDGPEPLCDTFFKNTRKGGAGVIGSVGACKNETCVHNESYECAAPGISVALHKTRPTCTTFVSRIEDV